MLTTTRTTTTSRSSFVYNANKKTDPNFHQEQVSKWERKDLRGIAELQQDLRTAYRWCFGRMACRGITTISTGTLTARTSLTIALPISMPGDVSTQQAQGNTRELNMLSWFGRVNYDFAGRYLFRG